MARKRTQPQTVSPPEQPKEDPEKRIVHTFTDGPARWGMQANGHYRPLAYGAIEPDVQVRPKGGNTHRPGKVMALVAGYGYPLRVMAVVNWGQPTPKDPDWAPAPGSRISGPADVIRWWPADELEVAT